MRPLRHLRAQGPGCLVLALAATAILVVDARELDAQHSPILDLPAPHIAEPAIPRGQILFQVAPSNTNLTGIHGPDGRASLGDEFALPALGTDRLPQFSPAEERFRELSGAGSDWILNIGAVSARFEADEQHLPVRVGYGLRDRVSIGVTGHFVRRRVESTLLLAGTGANVGRNPTATDNQAVQSFRSGAEGSLAALEAAVGAACEGEPDPDGPSCSEGQALLDLASSFLDGLLAAYDAETLFPLRGSTVAGALAERWSGIRSGLDGWNIESPEALPLATRTLDDNTFASATIEPWWGAEGFPRESPRAFVELGDIDLHVVAGLLETEPLGGRLRLRSTLVATARLPLAAADSMQLVAPLSPPRGVAGGGLRLVTDLTDGERFGLLAVAELWTYGSTDTFVLAPDRSRLLGEGTLPRAAVRWSPGRTASLALTPRYHVVPSVSLGGGYRIDHRGSHTFAPLEGEEVTSFPSTGATLHRIHAEFRYHGFEGPLRDVLPFPIELALGFDGTVGGSGDLAPVERRVHALLRVLRSR